MNIPGIDDCDCLYSVSSRDGRITLYLRVQCGKKGKWYCALTADNDVEHYVDDIQCHEGPFDSTDKALIKNIGLMRASFANKGASYVYCDRTRKIVRREQSWFSKCVKRSKERTKRASTVAEVIAALQKMNPKLRVYIRPKYTGEASWTHDYPLKATGIANMESEELALGKHVAILF